MNSAGRVAAGSRQTSRIARRASRTSRSCRYLRGAAAFDPPPGRGQEDVIERRAGQRDRAGPDVDVGEQVHDVGDRRRAVVDVDRQPVGGVGDVVEAGQLGQRAAGRVALIGARPTVTTSLPSSAFSASGVPAATIRPSSMIATRPHSWSASSRYWVVRKTVVPAALIRRTSSQMVMPAGRVEAGRRLVEEQHRRLVDQRGGQVEASLHAARVALDRAVGRVVQPDQGRAVRRPGRPATAPGTARTAARAARDRSGSASSPTSCSATPIRRRTAAGSRADVDAGDAWPCRR